MEARSCPGKHMEHVFTLRPVGFRDSLEVGVTYNCQCGCSTGLELDSPRCSGNGTYVCGLCECNPSHLGTRCECQEGESQSGYQNLCREAEGKPLCSGRGECSCNQCSCFESEFGKIYGPFCECDNFSCARNKGVLCSGRRPGKRFSEPGTGPGSARTPPQSMPFTCYHRPPRGRGARVLPTRPQGGDQRVECRSRGRRGLMTVDYRSWRVCCESPGTCLHSIHDRQMFCLFLVASRTGSSLGLVVLIPLLDVTFISYCFSNKLLPT